MKNRKIRINMSDYEEQRDTHLYQLIMMNRKIRINMSDYAEQKDTH